MAHLARFLGLTFFALGALSCTARPRTQLMLIVDADPEVRAFVTSLDFEIAGGPAAGALDESTTFSEAPTWPVSVAIIPRGGDATRQVSVVVTARGATRNVRGEVRTSFVQGRTLALHVFLAATCETMTCSGGSTCRRGVCETTFVAPTSLPELGSDAPETFDAGTDAPPGDSPMLDTPPDIGRDANCPASTDMVDLLLLIDTSSSMTQEQTLIANQVPELIRALSSGDVDGDGLNEYTPVTDLQIGVITPDLGTGTATAPGCVPPGDGAFLLSTSAAPSCVAPPYGPVIRIVDSDAAALAQARCLVQAGDMGCGFEQQLEAVLEAATPPGPIPGLTRAPFTALSFSDGSTGRGDTEPNSGLFREGAVLAIVMFTDEEDCSALDPSTLFDPTNAGLGALNVRCVANAELLRDVSRYIDGIVQLRQQPERIVFIPVVGLVTNPGVRVDPNYTAILADPAMIATVDTSGAPMVAPVCTSANGSAGPGRRYVEVAQGLAARGVSTTVQSICTENYQEVIRAIAYRIGRASAGGCR